MNSHANAVSGASGDCVKALEVLSENLTNQLGDELLAGLQIMCQQAHELVRDSHGYESEVPGVLADALRSVHDWPGLILMAETQRIVQNKPSLPTINAAIMVAGTQVLFSIRPVDYSDDRRGAFDLKAPDMSVMVHMAYRIVAEELMYLISEQHEATTVLKKIKSGSIDMRNMCREAVKLAIPRTLPLDDIIKYLMGDDVGRLVKSLNDQMHTYAASAGTAATSNALDGGDVGTSTASLEPPASAVGLGGGDDAATAATAPIDPDDVDDDETRNVLANEQRAAGDDDDANSDVSDGGVSRTSEGERESERNSERGDETSGNSERDERERGRDDGDRGSARERERDGDRERRDDSMYYRDRQPSRDEYSTPKKRRFF